MAYLQTDEELFANTPKIKGLLVKKIRTAFIIYSIDKNCRKIRTCKTIRIKLNNAHFVTMY